MDELDDFLCANVSRVKDINRELVFDAERQADFWKHRIAEYDHLLENLLELPKEITQSVMVPFGNCAFMPGKLRHTNEVLVLLGDSWFVECSAFQASEIANRRKIYCTKMLNKFEQQKKITEENLLTIDKFSKELGDNFMEIREYIPDQEAEISKIRTEKESSDHSASFFEKEIDESPSTIKVPVQPMHQSNESQGLTKVSEKEYNALMDRLDELLDQEREEEAFDHTDLSSSDQRFVRSELPCEMGTSSVKDFNSNRKDKRVSWPDITVDQQAIASVSDITTSLAPKQVHRLSDANNGSSTTPPSGSAPDPPLRSILKNRAEASPINADLLNTPELKEKCVIPGSVEAFSGIIQESSINGCPADENEQSLLGDIIYSERSPKPTTRRPSKFKLQRLAAESN